MELNYNYTQLVIADKFKRFHYLFGAIVCMSSYCNNLAQINFNCTTKFKYDMNLLNYNFEF